MYWLTTLNHDNAQFSIIKKTLENVFRKVKSIFQAQQVQYGVEIVRNL